MSSSSRFLPCAPRADRIDLAAHLLAFFARQIGKKIEGFTPRGSTGVALVRLAGQSPRATQRDRTGRHLRLRAVWSASVTCRAASPCPRRRQAPRADPRRSRSGSPVTLGTARSRAHPALARSDVPAAKTPPAFWVSIPAHFIASGSKWGCDRARRPKFRSWTGFSSRLAGARPNRVLSYIRQRGAAIIVQIATPERACHRGVRIFCATP